MACHNSRGGWSGLEKVLIAIMVFVIAKRHVEDNNSDCHSSGNSAVDAATMDVRVTPDSTRAGKVTYPFCESCTYYLNWHLLSHKDEYSFIVYNE